MDATALLLVLVSAGCHAYWNFLLKRAGGSHAFVAVSKASEAVVFLPAFVALLLCAPAGAVDGAGSTGGGATVTGSVIAGYVGVGTAIVLATYAALAAAYRHGDLSFAYPIARGGTLVFLPILGRLTLGEHLGPRGCAAVAAIVLGVLAMQLPALSAAGVRAFGAAAGGPATGYALAMAVVLAAGTVWDKLAVRAVPLFVYFYGYTAAVGACYLAFAVQRDGWVPIRAEWRARRGTAVAVGVLNTTSYGLVLLALREGGSTYVVGLRQLSIAAGVALGARFLGERVTAPRRLGVGLVVAGCLLMASGQ